MDPYMAVRSGSLRPLTLFKVFRTVLDREMTGVLSLESGPIKKAVHIYNGNPVRVDSNDPGERLLPAMVEEGLISSTECLELIQNGAEADPFLHLSDSGLVAAARVQAVIRQVARLRLLKTFAWGEGLFKFKESRFRPDADEKPIEVIALLLEAVARAISIQDCVRLIRTYESQYVTPTDWLERHASIFDTWFPPPNVRRVLVRPAKFAEIAPRFSDPKVAARQVCGLVLGGLATFQSRPNSAPAPTVAQTPTAKKAAPPTVSVTRTKPTSRPALRPQSRQTIRPPNVGTRRGKGTQHPTPAQDAQPRARSTPPPIPSAAAATPLTSAPPPQRAPRRTKPPEPPNQGGEMPAKFADVLRQAQELAAGLAETTHYEVLGVSKDADEKKIRLAFRALARKFHIDRFARYSLSPKESQALQKVFIAVNRANEVLSNPAERNEYDIALEMKAKGQISNSDAASGQLERALRAEQVIRQALHVLRSGNVSAARKKFAEGLKLTPDDPLAQSGFVYSEFLIAQSQGAGVAVGARARERLIEITQEFEGREEPFFFLGRVHRSFGDDDAAAECFKRALKLNPHFGEASSELRHLTRSGRSKKGGLLGRWKK